MTSITNLFSNFNDLTKTKSITNNASKITSHNINLQKPTPALSQGVKFNKYQKQIEYKLQSSINAVNSKEGFEGLQLSKNGLTNRSNSIIRTNDYSSQQPTIDNLRQNYKNTLNEYETVIAQISGSTTGYLNRVNPNNPYLNKTISFTSGEICYVTNQGVAKYISSTAILNSIDTPQNVVPLAIPWDASYAVPGTAIPTNPPLVAGTSVQSGQSLGNEGLNVFVNTLINNPSSTYEGCYADNATSPLMTFLGGNPSPPTAIQNGNFNQPQSAANS